MAAVTLAIPRAKDDYKWAKESFKNFKPLKKAPKLRADELEHLIAPLQLELDMENAALRLDRLDAERKSLARSIKLEKN